MPDLIHSLQARDIGFLRIVATLWHVELNAPDTHTAQTVLAKALSDPVLVGEVVETLPIPAQEALDALLQKEGRLPWSEFARRFGVLREMGPGQRDRKRPHEAPASPTEILWYRALISRAFFDTPTGPQEFAFIPDDLVPLLPELKTNAPPPPGRPASPLECAQPVFASDRILDHATTLLAGLRLNWPLEKIPWADESPPRTFLHKLLSAAKLLAKNGLPQPEPTRAFLEGPRPEALALLARTWLHSPLLNDLRQTPGLQCEGEWSNDPLRARQAVIDQVLSIPTGSWWSLSSFITAMKERNPDFQRSAGEYDAWFIRSTASGEYLRGFAQWEQVEGQLIRYILCGPLHWLGILDLAAAAPDGPPTALRLSTWAPALLAGQTPGAGFTREDGQLHVSSNGRVRLPYLVPRVVRYQIARLCDWEEEQPQEYRYRITTTALDLARQQGLRVSHLLALLRRYAATPPAPVLVRALERWEEQGTQARLEPAILLRLSSPEALAALRQSKAARFLGDLLGPTTVTIRPEAHDKVLAALLELGYLAESSVEQPGESIITPQTRKVPQPRK